MQCCYQATFWLCLLCKLWLCMRFCLKLDDIIYPAKSLGQWTVCLSIKVHLCINVITFKIVYNSCPHYLSDIYEYAPEWRIESRKYFAKLKIFIWKTKMRQKGLSYIGPSLWNNLPRSMNKTPFWILLNRNWKRNVLEI